MVTQDSVQSYLAYSKDSVVSHLISESLIRSELKVSDSAEHCLEIIVNILDSMLKSVHHVDSVKEMIKEYSSQVESAISFIMENTEKINREKYKNLLIQKIKNKELRDKIYDTVNLAGISKKVSLEKSNGIKTIIREIDAYQFNISTGLSEYFITSRWDRKNCNIFVIDGVLETVGEVHHLLEKASENKEPYILFVRSILPEVKSTISLNNARGTLDIVVVSVGMELDTLNILNDISICSGSQLISSNTGDLISAELRKDPHKIKKIVINDSTIEIYQPTTQNVKNHLDYLVAKRNTASEPDLIDLIENRISSISSQKVSLSIGHDILSSSPEAMEISDKFLRSLYYVLRNGIYHVIDEDRIPFLKTEVGHIYGSASLVCSYITAISCVRNVLSIGHVLLRD
jgi:chaperonin GroEL (HSP60 family)